MSEKGNEPED